MIAPGCTDRCTLATIASTAGWVQSSVSTDQPSGRMPV
jgi:hypothetical protein